MLICRFCGSERHTASRVRCEGCGGKEWRWKDDPAPAQPESFIQPKADHPKQPASKPDFGFKQDEPPTWSEGDGTPDIAESIGNFVAGCGWTIVLLLVAFLVYCAVRGTMETNRQMRAGRFEHGYETLEDIKDYPEEYARALKQRAEAREQEAVRMAKSKAAEETAEQERQRENAQTEAVGPEMPDKENVSRDQDSQ